MLMEAVAVEAQRAWLPNAPGIRMTECWRAILYALTMLGKQVKEQLRYHETACMQGEAPVDHFGVQAGGLLRRIGDGVGDLLLELLGCLQHKSTWWMRCLIYDKNTDPRHAQGEQDDICQPSSHAIQSLRLGTQQHLQRRVVTGHVPALLGCRQTRGHASPGPGNCRISTSGLRRVWTTQLVVVL